MATYVTVKLQARSLEAHKVLEVPDTGSAKVGKGTRIEPLVESATANPFVETQISSPRGLNPIVEKRDRCRVNDAK